MSNAEHTKIGFDHVGITVPDLESAVGFFTEHLGAEVVFELPRFEDASGEAPQRLGASARESFAVTMLRIGDAAIELVQWWPDVGAAVPPSTANAAHLALTVADVDAEWRRLGAVAGAEALGAPVRFESGPTPGLTNAFVRTPWGLLIELMSWPDGD